MRTSTISENIMQWLLECDTLFYKTNSPESKVKFLLNLKLNDNIIFDQIILNIQFWVEKMSTELDEPFIMEDEVSATREFIDALKEKYAEQLVTVELKPATTRI